MDLLKIALGVYLGVSSVIILGLCIQLKRLREESVWVRSIQKSQQEIMTQLYEINNEFLDTFKSARTKNKIQLLKETPKGTHEKVLE